MIGNYAVPILEDKTVWGTTDETRTAYLDSQDVARMALAALRCGGWMNAPGITITWGNPLWEGTFRITPSCCCHQTSPIPLPMYHPVPRALLLHPHFLRNDKTVGKTLTLSGPKAWSTREVIELCENLSDSDAKVKKWKGADGDGLFLTLCSSHDLLHS